MKTIQYAIDPDNLNVVSRCGVYVAYPCLDFGKMTPENGYKEAFYLDKFHIFDYCQTTWFNSLKWTKKIPVAVKNEHRKFWGMKPIKAKEESQ